MTDAGNFQASTDNLSSTSPQFQAASATISDAADSLNKAVTDAVSAFDGETQKNSQTLGNTCVKNMRDLVHAMDEISSRLQKV